MFVGDNGEVITFRHFKAWAVFYAVLLAATAAAAAYFWVGSRSPRDENRRLTRELSAIQEQLTAVKVEKDLMMARMVVSASRSAAAAAPASKVPPPLPKSTGEAPPPAAPAVPAPPPAVASAPAKAVSAESAGSVKTPVPAPAVQTPPVTPTEAPMIDVEELRVTHDVDNKMLHAQFMLRKVDADQGTVTGRTFVILKEKTDTAARWLSMPTVPLEEGRPTRVRNGRYFSISRFNVVKFSTPYDASTDAFSRAAILVYSLQGELMLEKPFDIRVTKGPPPDQDIGE